MYDAAEVNAFCNTLEREGLQPQAIINTHAHLDHIFGVRALQQRYGIPFGLHRLDLPVLEHAPASAMMFGFQMPEPPKADFFISHEEPLKPGDESLQVLLAPGHSPGSIGFYYGPGNWLIGGDVLFAGSIGRTDLPGGNHETLLQSIRDQFYPLPDETRVHPGHGPATTIGIEKRSNPFVQA
jgi:hydroxyacylglutathione hydrolase